MAPCLFSLRHGWRRRRRRKNTLHIQHALTWPLTIVNSCVHTRSEVWPRVNPAAVFTPRDSANRRTPLRNHGDHKVIVTICGNPDLCDTTLVAGGRPVGNKWPPRYIVTTRCCCTVCDCVYEETMRFRCPVWSQRQGVLSMVCMHPVMREGGGVCREGDSISNMHLSSNRNKSNWSQSCFMLLGWGGSGEETKKPGRDVRRGKKVKRHCVMRVSVGLYSTGGFTSFYTESHNNRETLTQQHSSCSWHTHSLWDFKIHKDINVLWQEGITFTGRCNININNVWGQDSQQHALFLLPPCLRWILFQDDKLSLFRVFLTTNQQEMFFSCWNSRKTSSNHFNSHLFVFPNVSIVTISQYFLRICVFRPLVWSISINSVLLLNRVKRQWENMSLKLNLSSQYVDRDRGGGMKGKEQGWTVKVTHWFTEKETSSRHEDAQTQSSISRFTLFSKTLVSRLRN